MNRFAFLLFVPAALAQSLIVGIPSTDVSPKGELSIAHESQGNVFKNRTPYWNSFTFGTYGIGNGVELAASLYGWSRPSGNELSVGAGFKKTWAPKTSFSERLELRTSAGTMLPMSFRGNGLGNWSYGLASIRVPKSRTRFTAGPSFGTRQIFGRTTFHMLVGVEQPLSKKVSWVNDWYTGTHDLGAAISAISWTPRKELLIIAGWKFANNARSGKPAAMLEVTYFFHPKKH